MLPKEDAAKKYLQTHYAAEFQQMSDLLAFAVTIVSGTIKGTKGKGLSATVIHTALGLYVKACKQFRSIQVLCEHGLTEDAHALTRNLLETTVALYFLLRHRVFLRSNGKQLPSVKGRPLTTRFRTELFLAHTQIQKEKMLNDWGNTKGMKRLYRRVLKTGFVNDVQWIKSRIGPEWAKRLKEKNYYSGTTFRDLAHSFRIGTVYAVLFRGASQFVHPGDAGNFIQPHATGLGATLLLQPGDKWLEPTKVAAKMLLCLCMDVVNARLGLGHDKRIQDEKNQVGLGAKSKG